MRNYRANILVFLAIGLLGATLTTFASTAEVEEDLALTDLSLEELMNIEVTSVSKQKQRIADAPAAITVINQDEIEQSGMSRIPELLRMVPGMNVGRIDANKWAISTRGFPSVFSNKLLVMMDGRVLYNHLFSGVYWQSLVYPMADLDRIEVIRGPGATIWGANAVNGVVNITTKSADQTQGWLISGTGSNVDSDLSVRYGGKIDDETFYRVYVQGLYTDNFEKPDPDGSGTMNANDAWNSGKVGFRLDRYASEEDTITVQGDLFTERGDQTRRPPSLTPPYYDVQEGEFDSLGGNLLTRWTHRLSDTSDMSLQVFYDYAERDDVLGLTPLQTFDAEFQHHFELHPRHHIIWGADVRGYWGDSEVIEPGGFALKSGTYTDYLISAFIQDDITLVPEKWHLSVGTKLEYRNDADTAFEPSARLLWTPDERNSVWAAVSYAARTPSRGEAGVDADVVAGEAGGLPFIGHLNGNPELESETLTAFELGYRWQPTSAFSLDVATFLNYYDDIRSFDPGVPAFVGAPVPHLEIPLSVENSIYGETYGGEIEATWNVRDNWRLVGSYSLLSTQMHVRDGSGAENGELEIEGQSPRHQFQIRSTYRPTRNVDLNAAAYYVDHLDTGDVPSYVRVDLSVGWRPTEHTRLAVGVQNLLDSNHPEFGSDFTTDPTETPRSVFVQFTTQF
jgi:iron complex outermembrane recepter protein